MNFRALNRRLSMLTDRLLPGRLRLNGASSFETAVVPDLLGHATVILDVGGGKRPFLSPERKRSLGARVIGIDIEADELEHAPPGSYDQVIVCDITQGLPPLEADLVICRSVLEHVADAGAAIKALAAATRPGGQVAIFVPCRNALFARVNLLLPEPVKHALLRLLRPADAGHIGFPARYDRATPPAYRSMILEAGLELTALARYYQSNYLVAFWPAYLSWRLLYLPLHLWLGDRVCESFSVVARRLSSQHRAGRSPFPGASIP
jgi:2-polyprenyl-6-hydroxyphenyl methylase/3-demethylubiquinone-9 3-methyltransferase